MQLTVLLYIYLEMALRRPLHLYKKNCSKFPKTARGAVLRIYACVSMNGYIPDSTLIQDTKAIAIVKLYI